MKEMQKTYLDCKNCWRENLEVFDHNDRLILLQFKEISRTGKGRSLLTLRKSIRAVQWTPLEWIVAVNKLHEGVRKKRSRKWIWNSSFTLQLIRSRDGNWIIDCQGWMVKNISKEKFHSESRIDLLWYSHLNITKRLSSNIH